VPLPSVSTPGAYGRKALDSELRRVLSAGECARNHTLYIAALRAGQLAVAGHVGLDDARAALVAAGVQAGLRSREVEATIASGLAYGLANPRAAS
jgi:hypothetical protein